MKPAPLKKQPHALSEDGQRCTACGRRSGLDAADCIGITVYQWEGAPENLKTINQLREMGLTAGGEPRGLLPYSKSADGYIRLYDVGEAKPKKPLTEKQIAALEKRKAAERAAWTCPGCGREKESKYKSLCRDCDRAAMNEEDIEIVRDKARAALTCDFVVFDSETTGLGGSAEIVSFAVLDRDGQTLMATFIKPVQPIPADATRIHGITDDKVADAPRFAEVHPQIFAALNGKVWVGYNVSFDEGMLAGDCHRAGLPMPEPARRVDVMDAYAVYAGDWSDYHGDYRWVPLSSAVYSLSDDERMDGSHGALVDATNTLALLRFLAKGETEAQTE